MTNKNQHNYKSAIADLKAELVLWDEKNKEREEETGDFEDVEEMKAVRRGIGFAGSMDRTLALVPVIISRFEEDLNKKTDKQMPNAYAGPIFHSVRQILNVIRDWLDRRFSEADILAEPSVPETKLTKAYLTIRFELNKMPKPPSRFASDITRLLFDLWILKGWIISFAENALRHGLEIPDEKGEWNEQEWCGYFWTRLKGRSSYIRFVEEHGYSPEALAQGFQNEVTAQRRKDRQMREFSERVNLEEKLNAAWDPDKPELFLELKKIPELPDNHNDDLEIIKVELGAEAEDDRAEPWSSSLPQLADWNKTERGSEGPGFRKDPVFKIQNEFLHKYFKVSKDNWKRYEMESEKPGQYRPPLDQYLITLLLDASGVMIHCLSDLEHEPNKRKLKGCYLFCAGVFNKFAEVVERNQSRVFKQLADEARRLAKNIIARQK